MPDPSLTFLDNDPPGEGAPVAGGNALVFQAAAVNAHANDRVGTRRIRLHVNIGGAAFVGIDDDLVGQAHHGAVIFAKAPDVVVLVVEEQGFFGEFAQNILDGAELGVAPGGQGEVVQDVGAQADEPAQGGAVQQHLDVFGFEEVFGVIDEHLDGSAVAAQGEPAVGFEEFEIEVFEEAAIDGKAIVKGQEGAAVEAGEGLAEVGFGDAVGVEQDGFDVTAFAARFGHGETHHRVEVEALECGHIHVRRIHRHVGRKSCRTDRGRHNETYLLTLKFLVEPNCFENPLSRKVCR